MNEAKIKIVEKEIDRFRKRVRDLREATARYKADFPSYAVNCPKEYGALRRASMDLTRALAELRKY